MPDKRTFIKLHDGMPDHPKIVGLSDRAFRTLVAGWCYCSRYLTDGHIPRPAWAQIVPGSGTRRGSQVVTNVTRELAAAGLVEEHPEHVEMHDYLDHQRSKAQVEHVQAVRSEAGKQGGRPPGSRATGKQNASGVESKTKPEGRGVEGQRTEEEELPPFVPPSSSKATPPASSQARPPAKRKGTRLPADFEVTPAMVAWAREKCPDVDGRYETEKFRDYWTAKPGQGGIKLDWPATWRVWMRTAQERAPSRAPARAPARRTGSNGHSYASPTDERIADLLTRTSNHQSAGAALPPGQEPS